MKNQMQAVKRLEFAGALVATLLLCGGLLAWPQTAWAASAQDATDVPPAELIAADAGKLPAADEGEGDAALVPPAPEEPVSQGGGGGGSEPASSVAPDGADAGPSSQDGRNPQALEAPAETEGPGQDIEVGGGEGPLPMELAAAAGETLAEDAVDGAGPVADSLQGASQGAEGGMTPSAPVPAVSAAGKDAAGKPGVSGAGSGNAASPAQPSAAAASAVAPAASLSAASPAKAPAKAAAKKNTGKGDLAAGIYFIVSKLSSAKVVGVSSKSKKDGANVDVWQVLGGKQQQWRLSIGKDGYATLTLLRSGKLLTVAGSRKANGTNVLQWKAKSKGNLNQKWLVKKQGAYYRLVSALDTSKVLNIRHSGKANGTNVNIWKWDKSARELFRFVPVDQAAPAAPGTQLLDDGVYTIHASGKGKPALDVAGHSSASGASVWLQGLDTAAGQAFSLTYDGQGYYRIVNVRSGKKLAVAAAAKLPGLDVAQYGLGNASDLAKWRIEKLDKGYRLVNKATSLALDVKGGTGADAGNVRVAKPTAKDSQRFTFKRKAAFTGGVFSFEMVGSSNLVLGITGAGTAAGAKAGTSKAAGGLNQRFLVQAYGDGYTIRPFSSRLYLTVSAANTLVQEKAKAKRAGQVWNAVDDEGRIQLVNAETGLALTVKGSAAKAAKTIGLAQPKAAKTQLLYARAANVVDDGVYYLHLSSAPKQVLNITKGRRTAGANVDTWQKRKAASENQQKFLVASLGGGKYSIINVASGRALEVAGGSGQAAANVRMGKATGVKRQQWKVALNDDFTLAFTNVATGWRLAAAKVKPQNGTNVKTAAPKDGAAAQEFWLTPTTKSTERVSIGVPCYLQNPQLPTGCESVALTNALRYWGFKLGKTTIADRWMPYGGNGVYNFIGNPRDSSGWIICAPGIANTANKYLKSKKSKVRAKNVTGTSLKGLRGYLDKGLPVVVWTTIGMGSPGPVAARVSGYPLRSNNHAVVLTGYDPRTGAVQVSDSLAGRVWRNGAAFNRIYQAMGKQAVVLAD